MSNHYPGFSLSIKFFIHLRMFDYNTINQIILYQRMSKTDSNEKTLL